MSVLLLALVIPWNRSHIINSQCVRLALKKQLYKLLCQWGSGWQSHLHQTSSYFIHHIRIFCQIWKIVAGQPGLFDQTGISHIIVDMQTYALVSCKQNAWYWGSTHGKSSWGMKMITHLHLVLRLKMRGVITALCLYTLIAWRGATLPFCQRRKHTYQSRLFTQTGIDTRRYWICGHSFKIKQCTYLH
jgi:hypothetical protein